MPEGAFDSLDAMRAEHADLVRASGRGAVPPRERVLAFLDRGTRTGTALDAPGDRRAAQGLLDYWKATLYAQARDASDPPHGDPVPPPPAAVLADFDADKPVELAKRAEAALAALSADDREAARRVLIRLVRLDPGGRDFRPVPSARATLEAAGDPAAVGRAIDALSAAGVLRATADGEVALAYESLLRTWDGLTKWLALRRQFRATAEFWDRTGRKPGGLVTGELLSEAARYRDLGRLEQDFVDASRTESERQAQAAAAAKEREAELVRNEAAARAREAEAARKEAEEARLRERLWRRAVRVGGAAALVLLTVVGVAAFQWRKALRQEERATDALNLKVKAYEDKEAAETAKRVAESARTAAETEVVRLQTAADEKVSELVFEVGALQAQEKNLLDRLTDAGRATATVSQAPPRALGWKLWRSGQPLRYRFLNGDPAAQARVMGIAAEWAKAAPGVTFVPSAADDAEVRVRFRPGGGSWACVGTDAQAVPAGQPTVQLDLSPNEPHEVWARVALRNFGFALGLIEETSSPNTAVKEWDDVRVYEHFAGPPYRWDRDRIQSVVLRRFAATELPWYRPFDRDSVMALEIPTAARLTIEPPGYAIPRNAKLSASDRAFVAALYPRPQAGRELAVTRAGASAEGALKTFRAFDRYSFAVAAPTAVAFEVRIAPNAGFALTRASAGGAPEVIQSLTTPTQKEHRFVLELKPGRYEVDFFGRLPAEEVTPPFGAAFMTGGRPEKWNAAYTFRLEATR